MNDNQQNNGRGTTSGDIVPDHDETLAREKRVRSTDQIGAIGRWIGELFSPRHDSPHALGRTGRRENKRAKSRRRAQLRKETRRMQRGGRRGKK